MATTALLTRFVPGRTGLVRCTAKSVRAASPLHTSQAHCVTIANASTPASRWAPGLMREERLGRGQLQVRRAKTESMDMALGTPAPDFKLTEPLTGKVWSLADFDGSKALLVMIICNHCPFVVMLKESIVELAKEYIAKGVGVVAISSNSTETHPQDGPAEMAKDAVQYGYPFPYLYDEDQSVAKAYLGACTPEFYVFDADRRLAYHGQYDDARPKSGVVPTGKDLRAALDAVLAGQPVPSQRPSIGCNIKWRPGNEPGYFGTTAVVSS